MSKLFGGKFDKSHDIRDIVASLQSGTDAICNESVSGAQMSAMEIKNTADMIARTVFDPIELPVGILLAFLCGPFFLYLIQRNRKGDARA